MSLTTKDAVGIVLVAGTFGALLYHNAPTGHRETHVSPVANAGGSVTSAEDVATIAFVDVNVVPMERNETLRNQTVFVRDGFVVRIADADELEPPVGATVIEGGGTAYLTPGLTDAHVHLGDDAESLLPLFLANGVTTVFNLEGTPEHLALRQAVLEGRVTGPTIYTAGPFVDGNIARSPVDARRAVVQQKLRGYDFVKVHGDMDAESFASLGRAGREQGIPIIGHAPRNLSFSAVLANHQADVAHAEELIYTQFMSLNPAEVREVGREMVDAGTWLTPALVSFENTASQWGAPEGRRAALARPGTQFLPSALRRRWESYDEFVAKDPAGRGRIEEMRAFHTPLVHTLSEAGVPLLAGTDAGVPGLVPGFSLPDEILALEKVGLTPYQALAAATRNAGLFIREKVDESANFGTVQVGARADLVLLDRDPRATVEALRRPRGVMVRGRWLDRAALDSMLSAAGR